MKFIVIILCSVIICTITGELQAQIQWLKDPANPVALNGASGTWNRDVFNPFVIFNEDSVRYEMWFSAYNGDLPYRIGFAVSKDGSNWVLAHNSPVLSPDPGAWDSGGVFSSMVIREGGQYKMWYGGGTDFYNKIGYATSPDGINWTKYAGNPIIVPDALWELDATSNHFVMHSSIGYQMWYAGGVSNAGGTGGIGYATSVDGLSWVKDTTHNPVLHLGGAGQWDNQYAYAPRVAVLNGLYCMWYSGINYDRRIGLATSIDSGKTWTKYPHNPVLSPTLGTWDAQIVQDGLVMLHNDTLHMWYAGSASGSLWKIGHAISSTYGNIICAVDYNLNKNYARKNIDSILFTTRFSNILGHPFTPHVIYSNAGGTVIDSLSLFDDGLHGDSLAGDSLFGAYIHAPDYDDFFTITVSALELEKGWYFITSDLGIFTTAGPVIVDSVSTTRLTKSLVNLYLWLRNTGSNASVPVVTGKIRSTDPSVTSFQRDSALFRDIGAGNQNPATIPYRFTIDTTIECEQLEMSIDIRSNGTKYWSQSFTVPMQSTPVLSCSCLEFGSLHEGESKMDSVVLRNEANCPLVVSSVSNNLSAVFHVTPTSASIAPYDSETFYITFDPDTFGAYNGTVMFNHNASGYRSTVAVRGALPPPSVQMAVAGRWNMVSVPIHMSNYHKAAVFPGATSAAFYFRAGYRPADTLLPGNGYWLKFPRADTLTIPGFIVTAETINVEERWNMIGSISAPVPVSAIGSIPGGLTTTGFYYYNDGPDYVLADTIKPGKGYWVKVNQPGKLILSASSSIKAKNRICILLTSETPPSPPSDRMELLAKERPKEYRLDQNYPNPFNPTTTINFSIPHGSRVVLKVYNILGEEVATLFNGGKTVGEYSVVWDAKDMPSGVYWCRLISDDFSATRQMVLLK